MKKVLFFIMSFLMFVSITNATINDVSFVGGTGGSKILDLTHENNKINTSGVIYDKDASLVYEITYTNDTDYNKKIADVTIPNNKKLKYKIIDLDNDKVILPGETVKFKYSIYSEDDRSFDELQSLNESAELQMSMGTVIVSNPNTVDLFFVAVFLFAFSFVCYKRFKSKKAFYAGFTIFLLVSVLARKDLVLADEEEMVQINTNIKYILSNLAPSCANTNYTGDFCIDWKTYGNRDVVNYLVMEDTKNLPNTYSIGDVNFTLQSIHDVSEQQNGDVILGVYKVNDQESYLFLIGQDGGVVVPKDASYQFTSYDVENNDYEYDFHYVKYIDFSKFYSNKTTNMSYMLVGIGTLADMIKYDLTGFETSNVTDMSGMFIGFAENTKNFKLDLSNFDTSKVTDMKKMFFETAYYSESVDLDLSKFDTGSVTNMSGMFNLFAANANEIKLNIYDWNTSKVTDMSAMFLGYAQYADYAKIDFFKNWDTSCLTDMSSMFAGVVLPPGNINRDKYTEIDLTGLDTQNVTDMCSLFYYNTRVREIDMSMFDASNLENMGYMFTYTVQAKKIKFGEKFVTSKVTSMDNLFSQSGIYYRIDEIDISMFDFSSTNSINSMFSNCGVENLKLDSKGFENVISSVKAFSDLPVITTLDLSKFNFVNLSDYTQLFGVRNSYIGRHATTFDLSGSDWNEEAVVTDMFKNIADATIYVKDEKAKSFIEKQAPNCTVVIKEK